MKSKNATKMRSQAHKNGNGAKPHKNGKQGKSDGKTADWELITPQTAGDWLTRNNRNRRMSDGAVKRLAGDIVSGNWVENGESVIFDWSGNLLNGQHRLAAIIVANKPVMCLVVRGIDPAAFDTIDSGRPRRMSDVLYIEGEQNSTQLASALQALYRWENNGNFSAPVAAQQATRTQLAKLLEKHPNIRDSIIDGQRLRRRLPNAYSSVMTVLHYVLSGLDGDLADDFFEKLYSGADLGSDDPIYRLRERLILAKGNAKISANEVGAITIKAWNAKRAGKKVNQLGWRGSGPSPEGFPVPV